jgi:hypothetical protein
MSNAGKPLSIFIACVASEMEPERSHLDSVVLPVLWQRFGPVELCWSAPAETAEDLRKELELARRSDFFVALIGESCGQNGRARPASDRSFRRRCSNNRNSKSKSALPEKEQNRRLSIFARRILSSQKHRHPTILVTTSRRSPDKFASLKKWIRTSGLCAVPIGARTSWRVSCSEDLGAAISDRQSSRREAEQIAIPPPAPSPEEHAPSEPYLDQNVQFTVFRPDAIEPNKWHPLIAFAHLSEKRPDAPADEPDPLEEVQRQA